MLVRDNRCGHTVLQKDKPRGFGGARAAGPWVPDGAGMGSLAPASGATDGFRGGAGAGSWNEGLGTGMLSGPFLAVGDLFPLKNGFRLKNVQIVYEVNGGGSALQPRWDHCPPRCPVKKHLQEGCPRLLCRPGWTKSRRRCLQGPRPVVCGKGGRTSRLARRGPWCLGAQR